jgi:Flp pilus assembly protein TadD
MLEGNPEMVFVAMIFAGGLVYIASSYALFHTVVPYTVFWMAVAIGMGFCIRDNPRILTLRFNISKVFSYSLVGLLVVSGCFGTFLASRALVANAYYYEAHNVEANYLQAYYQEFGDEGAAVAAAAAAAVPYFKKAHEWNGSEMRYYWSYAHALLREASDTQDVDWVNRNCNEAQRIITEGLDREPESAMLYYNRAVFRDTCEGGIASDATVADIYKAIELYEHNYLVYQFLAELETTRGNLQAAVAADELGLIVSPKFRDGWMRLVTNYMALGDYYSENGDLDEAQEQYEAATNAMDRAIENYPGDAGLGLKYIDLGKKYDARGDSDEARERYEAAVDVMEMAIEISPGDVSAHYYLALAYDGMGNADIAARHFEEAIGLLEEGIKASPERADYYYMLGVIYEATGELEKAKEQYEKAVELNPGFPEAIQALEDFKGSNVMEEPGESE